jgi:hypothetical protein
MKMRQAQLKGLVGVLTLAGMMSCSTTPPTTAKNNTAATSSPTVTPGGTPTVDTAKAPTTLTNAGEYGENIYDLAKANSWAKAAAKLSLLKNAAGQLRVDLKSAGADEDRLDTTIAAVDKAVTTKDRQAAMVEANQITRIVADMSVRFRLPVPIEVTQLDYQGRELEIWAEAKDATKLKATADDMRRTWDALRPQVESHRGAAEAKRFGELVSRVEAAKTSDEFASLATPVLDEVDNLEKVFKK